jgi:D-alanine-D-alanine ligase
MGRVGRVRVLILHSEIAPDAPPDDQDTLLQAAAIERTLKQLGHEAKRASFNPEPAAMESVLARECPDLVFNLVETVWGSGLHASLAPAMLTRFGVPFTGCSAGAIAACGDKIFAKRAMVGAGLPTPDWSEAPAWCGIGDGRWIVKSVSEDASLGLDDGAVVQGREAVAERAQACAARYGGRWFAERYIEGREFNVALIEKYGAPFVLPIGEMLFERWDDTRPRIIGYAAKWDETAPEYRGTTRVFDWQERAPRLHRMLEFTSRKCWSFFDLSGYARVDFRVDAEGRPFILEVNPNPCLESNAGFAAACEQAGMNFASLISEIVKSAVHG